MIISYLGLAYLLKDEETTALSYFNKALTKNPKEELSYFFRGSLYTEYAERALWESNKPPSGDEKTFTELQKQILEYTDKALKDFEALLSLNPAPKGPVIQEGLSYDASEVLVHQARCYKYRHEDEKAKALYEKVVREYPDGVGYEEAKMELEQDKK